MKNVAPSYSRGRDETSRTRPNTPLEPAQPDFACSTSNETEKLEMDEFRRLKVMYPTAPVTEGGVGAEMAESLQHRPQHQQEED